VDLNEMMAKAKPIQPNLTKVHVRLMDIDDVQEVTGKVVKFFVDKQGQKAGVWGRFSRDRRPTAFTVMHQRQVAQPSSEEWVLAGLDSSVGTPKNTAIGWLPVVGARVIMRVPAMEASVLDMVTKGDGATVTFPMDFVQCPKGADLRFEVEVPSGIEVGTVLRLVVHTFQFEPVG
jgi:hypothetical protein